MKDKEQAVREDTSELPVCFLYFDVQDLSKNEWIY
jgi:hypothetical protein